MEIHQEIGKWGNSLGLRIPAAVAESLGIKQGDDVTIAVENDAIVIKPSREPSLEERLAAFNMQSACKGYEQCDPIPEDVMDVVAMQPVGREIL